MKYLLSYLFLWVLTVLLILFTGCVTINKTYLPAAKKDTVYLPCNKIHITYSDYPIWRSEPFYPFYRQHFYDTSSIRLDTIKIDTLKYKNDSTFILRSYPLDSVRVRKS